MEYTFKSVFQFIGVSHQQNDDVVIVDDDQSGINALFTKHVDEQCLEIDTGVACASLMLKGMFGGERIEDFATELDKEIKVIRNSRAERLSNGAILVISIKGEEELNIKENLHKELEGLRVCWDAVDKDKLKEKHMALINGILSSISMASDPDYGVLKLTDGVYFRDETGKLLFSYTAKFGAASVVVSKGINTELVTLVRHYSQSAKQQNYLKRVFQLYVQSLDMTQDKFRSYLACWGALEIFVNKVFGIYEDKFISSVLSGHNSAGVDGFLSRIRSVMNGKYNPLDKFTLISSYLGKNQEEEIRLFKDLKELRDKIYHGTEVEESTLPVEKLRNLLAEYLKAHFIQTEDA